MNPNFQKQVKAAAAFLGVAAGEEPRALQRDGRGSCFRPAVGRKGPWRTYRLPLELHEALSRLSPGTFPGMLFELKGPNITKPYPGR